MATLLVILYILTSAYWCYLVWGMDSVDWDEVGR